MVRRLSSCCARSIWWCSCRLCGRSNSTVAPASRRLARRMMATAMSRSRISAATLSAGGGSASRCRCAFRNNCGSWRIRWRMAGVASRQAAYNCPASRLLNRCWANTSAMRWQSSRQKRAMGTRNFMATWAEMVPLRTCCCTLSGSSSTSARRRDTQLRLRSKRRASSSSP